MVENNASDKSKSTLDAKTQLQDESHEFITRTLAMHNWLREAYWLLCEKPDFSTDELFENWKPAFKRIYGHLFATFLRPYRMMMFPFGAYPGIQVDSSLPGTQTNTYMNTIRSWGALQEQFFKGLTSMPQQVGLTNNKPAPDSANGLVTEQQGLKPTGLTGDETEQAFKSMLQILEQSLNYFSESYFPLPKNLVPNLKQLIDTYPKAYSFARTHEGMLNSTWEKSLKIFTVEIKKSGSQIPEFRDFYNTYTNIFTQEYNQLLASKEFIEVQNNFMEMSLDVTAYTKKVMEAQLEIFPALPFTTEREMAALEQTVHNNKRKINSLERRVREIERDAIAMSARVEVKTPVKTRQRKAGKKPIV